MEPTTMILFGATGDLAKRKIYPALYNLFLGGKLPHGFSVFGLGRREWSDEVFRSNVEQAVRQFSRRKPKDIDQGLTDFLGMFRYNVLEIDRESDYRELLSVVERREAALRLPPNRLFYLSVGPEHFETIALNVRSSGLGSASGWKRLVIEKPFGHDLQSARDLNRVLNHAFAEEEIYRIDHYLGKPVVQQLKALQQANPVLQALWSHRYIANVQISAGEADGVGLRAGYYDHIGALRDMFQNHLLQLLMTAAIQLSQDSGPEEVRWKKRNVMEAVDLLQKEDVRARVVRGQYAAGRVGGQDVVGYTREPGIAPDSRTETFVAARLHIDNNAWRGVPFYLRTGKRMKDKSTRIVVEFKEPLRPKSEGGVAPNLLIIEIGPNEGISLQFNATEHGPSGGFKPVRIELHRNPEDSPESYENLIGDALEGDATYFAHWDEIELSWRWVQPVLDAFEEELVPLHYYEAGSCGPDASDALLAADGNFWWLDDREERTSETKEGERYASYAN
ncbi:glucose-6-phosphate dehydrogenase [Paenibacillus sp.]|uniref:glucose-6-phosphate dehydrogenase n=1 Tax=Paenibacillus sp. TaxID=58172 RepID=UPI002812226C|nr:glucose-6-phosphate dehydrogenase [Paenibacillus sp.]